MSDLITTGTSGYALGDIDSATVLVSNVSPISAKHPNGLAAAIVQIETILGSGTSLKGTLVDLVTRLAVALNPTGTHKLDAFAGLTVDRGLIASSSSVLSISNHTPIGVIQAFAGSSTPAHWLSCDGGLVSRVTYSKLFTAIGVTYGAGNGSTTFNLPDLKGRTIIMVDGTADRITSASTNGVNADTLGGVGGNELHTLSAAQIPPLGLDTASTAGTGVTAFRGSATGPVTVTGVNTNGGAAGHSNTQPWIALNYIIFAGV